MTSNIQKWLSKWAFKLKRKTYYFPNISQLGILDLFNSDILLDHFR